MKYDCTKWVEIHMRGIISVAVGPPGLAWSKAGLLSQRVPEDIGLTPSDMWHSEAFPSQKAPPGVFLPLTKNVSNSSLIQSWPG